MTAGKKILIVDDDADYAESTRDLLEAHGYDVASARDGQSGLKLAREVRPDLILLDVMMAHMTEGFEISRKIPAAPELKNTKVILVTGIRKEQKLTYAFEPDKTWLPVDRILEKPVPPAKLLDEIRKALR